MQHVSVKSRSVAALSSRLTLFASIAICEVFVTSYLFNFPISLPEFANPLVYAKGLVHVVIAALFAFLLVAWPRRQVLIDAWKDCAGRNDFALSVLFNLCIFSVLVVATVALSGAVRTADAPPFHLLPPYFVLLFATGVTLAMLAAPLAFWQWLARTMPVEIVLAFSGGLFVVVAGEVSSQSWQSLSAATLHFAHWILSAYEPNVYLDVDEKVLGAGRFRVLIMQNCSGYEGIGLVLAFLSLYTWSMRHALRFPNALLLLPVGVAAVWLLNAVRIAALISIGAHLSPSVALNGFHSQGGWIGFLTVALGAMLASRHIDFFRADADRTARPSSRPRDRLLLALVVPFMAMMAASIVEASLSPYNQWLYGLKVVAILAALWWFRASYSSLAAHVSPLALLAGTAVGGLWVATQTANDSGLALGVWLALQPPGMALAWILLRAAGSILLVPIAEELAFRGYLYRFLIAREFDLVPASQFNWIALVASSVLFGAMHQRWMAAALAGAVYALLMLRSGRLADAIAAHMASNAVIVLAAVALGNWSLL